jgi:hypothetical protein
MARGLTTAVKNEYATRNINAVHLVEIDLGSTIVYFTENSFNLVSDISGTSQTYLSSGVLLDVTNVQESAGINLSRLNLTLTGVDQTYISLALNNNITHNNVNIYRALLDASNTIIANPFLLYKAFINGYEIIDNNNTATIKLDIESHFANASQINGRITNNKTQQRFFINDTFFKYSDQIFNDIQWGKQTS